MNLLPRLLSSLCASSHGFPFYGPADPASGAAPRLRCQPADTVAFGEFWIAPFRIGRKSHGLKRVRRQRPTGLGTPFGLAVQLLSQAFLIVLAGIALALGFAFGLGCKDLAREIVLGLLMPEKTSD